MIYKYSLHLLLLAKIFSTIIFSQEKIIVKPIFTNHDSISNLYFKETKRPKIALVLSGGGARGMAHVGALKVLEQHNIPIDIIVGTSMGSIVGGLYASGYSTDDLQKIVDSTNWTAILSLGDESDRDDLYLSQKQLADRKQLTIRFDGLTPIIPSSFSTGQRLTNFINQLTLQSLYHPVRNFDDLKIPFRSVATDLVSGKRIVFSNGSVSEALRSSISVPLLYSPIKKDSLELTDGGLVSNIPVDVAKEMGADIIIAVDVTSPLRASSQLGTAWEVADQIINIMAQSIKKELLQLATIVVKPDLGLYSASDFSKIKFVVQQGENAMRTKISALKDSIRNKRTKEYYDASTPSHFQFTTQSLTFDSPLLQNNDTLRAIINRSINTLPALQEALTSIYNTGWFADLSAEIQFTGSLAAIIVHSKENPVLNAITITGNSIVPSSKLSSSYSKLLHKPFNFNLLRNANEDMLTMYRNEGYSLARIRSVEYDSVKKELTIDINEGTIQKIVFEGKSLTRDWVIRRELPFEAGDIFTVHKAKKALENLTATNLFEQVLIDIRFEGELPAIVINIKEKKSELTRIGFRLDSERNLQPTISMRSENILGTATEAGIGFAGGLRNQRYALDAKAIRVLNTYFTANIVAYYDTREIFAYENNSAISSAARFERLRSGIYKQNIGGITFSLGQQVEKFGTVSVEYRLEANELENISGTGYASEQFSLQALRVSSFIDTQDKFPFARSGSVTNVYWENATSTLKGIIGSVGYSKIFLSYEWFTPIGVHTLHPKFQIGFGDRTLPVVQQFSWGGEDSFYGLLEDDARGRQIILTSLELRSLLPFKLVWDTYFKIRYDFGNIWPQQENITVKDFHHGIGAGLSLDTPIGPANISVGRSFYVRRDLLEQPFTLGSIATYFSIGYALN